jgi:hypothetical protein
LGQFSRIIELFTQKIVSKLSKYGFGIRDPRSESGIRNTGKTERKYKNKGRPFPGYIAGQKGNN